MSSKKRYLPLANVPRLPLKETSGNIPLPQLKRPRTETAPDKKTASRGRLLGDELVQWQTEWRKIMRESTVYFELALALAAQTHEHNRAVRFLRLIGCLVPLFFDGSVTIIVLRRKYEDKPYPPNDIFSQVAAKRIKVWDYDKVFRFLRNLGVAVDDLAPDAENLSTLLKEERIYGATERDPTARRDDLHYLDKNYLYVYDLSQKTRPVAVREWADDLYPRLYMTADGKCPFIPDHHDNTDKKRARRAAKFDQQREYREALRYATTRLMGDVTTDGDDETTVIQPLSRDDATIAPPVLLPRQLLVARVPCDVTALGYNGALNLVQMLMELGLHLNNNGGNGLGPMTAAPLRNLTNLKRRIIRRKQQQQPKPREREHHPGYCENCRIKYDNFDDHITSTRHRRFANDRRNFEDIDMLIATLQESSSINGGAPSNGLYNLA